MTIGTKQKERLVATGHGVGETHGVDEVRRVDVVVVGSGVSGSAAAMTAARRGAKVALLEKQAAFGGSAALSAGMFWTAPSRRCLPEADSAGKRGSRQPPGGRLRGGARGVAGRRRPGRRGA
ncbi:FAD-dependent oxidoreductase [Arthrobacter sp. ok362]|uniref:FAD-dependent oxidoreductase n=1 Tax=Arthrobacter sp. ok362 TaxID=1761745 RepID=UPI000B80D659|nr:FAD-dependent oxidoreductase [Arthrobacter sp. ok362]